jgi:hypothetical protein
MLVCEVIFVQLPATKRYITGGMHQATHMGLLLLQHV